MNEFVAKAAALIREIDPSLAAMFISRPFHRRTIVNALYLSMSKCNLSSAAGSVRNALNQCLNYAAKDQAAAEAAQL